MIKSFDIHHAAGTEPWGYVDIDIYVLMESGEEWLYRVSKDLEEGVILSLDPPRYAETQDDDFDETDKPVPQEVHDLVAANMAEILVKIGRAQAEYELAHG